MKGVALLVAFAVVVAAFGVLILLKVVVPELERLFGEQARVE